MNDIAAMPNMAAATPAFSVLLVKPDGFSSGSTRSLFSL